MTASISSAPKKQAAAQKDRETQAALLPSAPITADRIRTRAYELYVQRKGNGGQGDATSDWLQAERELNRSAPDPSATANTEIKVRARGERLLASGK
jgi:hypothetical protein